MNFTYFIGTDVSKNELDFAVMQGKNLLFHKEIGNSKDAIKCFFKELNKLPGFDLSEAVFCLEHTGIYNNHLLVFLNSKGANVCLEIASQIKNSLGNIRGKNDKIDSIRIAEYAYKNREELSLWKPKREIVQKLSYLASTRTRLLQTQKILKTPLKEFEGYVDKSIVKENNKLTKGSLDAIKRDIVKTEEAISEVIASDSELKRLFGLITSVNGIGAVTATQIIITTNEFKDIKDPKKFACYSGIVPFTKESGLFKGRAKVSHMANKKMKTLLHMASLVAIAHDEGLKQYYDRKVKEENKNKMSVINAVRNKMILRVFACVNQNRKYENNYTRKVA